MPRVLNVAEKNSVAKRVTEILSQGRAQRQQSCATYSPNYSFPFNLGGMQADMAFTSVAGHLQQLEFVPPYSSWHSCSPKDLYDVAVSKQVPKGEPEKIKQNLQNLARGCQWLVLWLDCDREGENIAFEVIDVCIAVNPRLVIKRARFSALIERDIFHAVHNLVAPNADDAKAVDARQEIDLRVGSSFTRLQTLLLQDKFDWGPHLPAGRDRMLLSYGPCQFPTLGLLVQREWEIQAHVPEAFWYISLHYRSPGPPPAQVEFKWDRHRLYDREAATVLHQLCLEAPGAVVASVQGSRKTRWAPNPLSTLEMQKRASQYLRISGERIMKLAEELYQAGFVSYPRTETDIFDRGYDLKAMVRTQADSGAPWAAFAQRLDTTPLFRWPKPGGHDDKAHPPIHPTKAFAGDGNSEKMRLYEFIARHFLACCAQDAVGQETKVALDVGGEGFTATGLMVEERNWLDVYKYTSWGGAGTLPPMQQGQQFVPASIDLREGRTQAPPRLQERDLIAKMEEHGIGTDATVADHISKQLERGYASKDEVNLSFAPTLLGEALIGAYRRMGLSNLWMPTLRGVIETNITAVAQGRRTKDSVLAEAMQAFKQDFASAQAQAHLMEQEVGAIAFAGAAPLVPGAGGGPGGGGGQAFGACTCGAQLVLLRSTEGQWTFRCSAHPLHALSTSMPRFTQSVSLTDEVCTACAHGQVRKLAFSFALGLAPPGTPPVMNACALCDRGLKRMLELAGPGPRRAPAGGGMRGGGGGGYGRGQPAGRGALPGRGAVAGRGAAAGRGGRVGRGGAQARGRGVAARGGRAGGGRGRGGRQ